MRRHATSSVDLQYPIKCILYVQKSPETALYKAYLNKSFHYEWTLQFCRLLPQCHKLERAYQWYKLFNQCPNLNKVQFHPDKHKRKKKKSLQYKSSLGTHSIPYKSTSSSLTEILFNKRAKGDILLWIEIKSNTKHAIINTI